MRDLVLDPASVREVVTAADATVRSCARARAALSDVSAALSLPSDAGRLDPLVWAVDDAVAIAARLLDQATRALSGWSREATAAVGRMQVADSSHPAGPEAAAERLLLLGGRLLEPAAAIGAAAVRIAAQAEGLPPPVSEQIVRLPGEVARLTSGWFGDGPGWATAAGRPPDLAELGADTGTALPGGSAAVRDLLAGIDALAPGTIAVVPVTGTDGTTRYLVELRGLHAVDAGDPEDFRDAVPALFARTGAYAGAIRRALDSLCLPRGSELLLAGHSLGGIAAMDLARDPAFNGAAFRVTQVLTAGSPVSGLHPVPGTSVLEIDNADDLVPHLDLRDSRAIPGDGDGRAVAVFGHDTGTVGGNHSLARSYEPFVSSPRFGRTPGVGQWLGSARSFLTGTPRPGVLFSLTDRPP